MSRLTGRPIEDKNYKVRKTEGQEWENAIQNSINKLGKLEDLEEELGCPLDVVFRAMKYGIEFEHKLTNDKLISKSFRIFYFQNEWVIRAYIERYNTKESYGRYLKDYQKTWWIKGEKNEN